MFRTIKEVEVEVGLVSVSISKPFYQSKKCKELRSLMKVLLSTLVQFEQKKEAIVNAEVMQIEEGTNVKAMKTRTSIESSWWLTSESG